MKSTKSTLCPKPLQWQNLTEVPKRDEIFFAATLKCVLDNNCTYFSFEIAGNGNIFNINFINMAT